MSRGSSHDHRRSRRGPYRVGDQRRAAIVEAAISEFAEFGYSGTSMLRVAREAGISPTGLRHHFATKDGLLVEVLRERDRRRGIDPDGDPEGTLTFWEELDGIVDGIAENAAQRDLTRLFSVISAEATMAGSPAQEWALGHYRTLRRTTASAIRRAIDAGEVASDVDPEALAVEIYAVMDGLQVQWLLSPEEVDMSAVFAGYLAALRDRVRPRTG